MDFNTHTFTVQGTKDYVATAVPTKTSQLTNDSSFTTLTSVSYQEHNYRYMHNVRLYLANKMLFALDAPLLNP